MNLTKEQLNHKYENTIQTLSNLEQKWFEFVQNNKKLRNLIRYDPDKVDPKILESIPLDVQLWTDKCDSLFSLLALLQSGKTAMSEEILNSFLDGALSFWCEIKDCDPQGLSIFQNKE